MRCRDFENPAGNAGHVAARPDRALDAADEIIRDHSVNPVIIRRIRLFTDHAAPDFDARSCGVKVAFHNDQVAVGEQPFELFVTVCASFLAIGGNKQCRHVRR